MPFMISKLSSKIEVGDSLVEMINKKKDNLYISKKTLSIIKNKIMAMRNSGDEDCFEKLNKAWLLSKEIKVKNEKLTKKINKYFLDSLKSTENYSIKESEKSQAILISKNKNKTKNIDFSYRAKDAIKQFPIISEVVVGAVKETINPKAITQEDTLKDIFNKKKDNESLSGKTLEEIELRIEKIKNGRKNDEILNELNQQKEYLLEVNMKPDTEMAVNIILDKHIIQTKLKIYYNLVEYSLREKLNYVGISKESSDNVLEHINKEKEKIGVEKFVKKIDLINKLLGNEIYYLNKNEISESIFQRFNSSIENLESELKNRPEISKETQFALKSAKNNILEVFKKELVSQEVMDRIGHIIDKEKNNPEPDELVRKINMISQIILLSKSAVAPNNAMEFFSENLKLSIETLNKKVDKLWYQQLTFKEKVQLLGRQIKRSFVDAAKTIKHFFVGIFFKNSQTQGQSESL